MSTEVSAVVSAVPASRISPSLVETVDTARSHATTRARGSATDLTSRSTRELATLRLLAAFRALRMSHLLALLAPGEALTPASRGVVLKRTLRGLRRSGLVTTLGTGIPAYLLTTAGAEAYATLDPRFPARRLRATVASTLEHALLVADIALAFRDALSSSADSSLVRWQSDWEICARLGSREVIPDAFLTYDRGDRQVHAFIEADRATEFSKAFARKIERYLALHGQGEWRAALPVWPLVLTVTTTHEHAASLARTTAGVLAAAQAKHLMPAFRFTTRAALLAPPGALGAIWRVCGREGASTPTQGLTPLATDAERR